MCNEVTKVVRDLKPNKAAGPDDVHNALLKKIPMRAWTEITKVFNACLREGVYPEVWNTANVVPVPKPGKKLDRPNITDRLRALPAWAGCSKRYSLTDCRRSAWSAATNAVSNQIGGPRTS